MLSSEFTVRHVYALKEWLQENGRLIPRNVESSGVTQAELERISTLVSAPPVLAVVEIPKVRIEHEEFLIGFRLVLDGIRDPGNMGTIIRTADWFGIQRIVASDDSAEFWNPKVVQSSMGSLTRVKVITASLPDFFERVNEASRKSNVDAPAVYGAFMEGQSLYEETFAPSGLIVFGNESNGIRTATEAFVDRKISIPSFAIKGDSMPESLNVAVAAALILGELKRQSI